MIRLIASAMFLFLATLCRAQSVVQLSTSPLIAMEWTADPAWKLHAAIPSPDCDYAVELLGPAATANGTTLQPIRWTGMSGTVASQETVLRTSPLAGEAETPSRFYYSQEEGFLPIIERRVQLPRTAAGFDNTSFVVGGPGREFLGYRHFWFWKRDGTWIRSGDGTLRTVMRDQQLPLLESVEHITFGTTPVARNLNEIRGQYHMLPDGSARTDLSQPPYSFPALTADETGQASCLAIVGGRIGKLDLSRPPGQTALLEPTVPSPGPNPLLVCGGNADGNLGAVVRYGNEGLQFLSWDADTSQSVTLFEDDGWHPTWYGPSLVFAPDSLYVCRRLPNGRWVVGFNYMRLTGGLLRLPGPALWMIEGDRVLSYWQAYDPTSPRLFIRDGACDLSVGNDPLFAFAFNYRIVGVRWDEAHLRWNPAALAEADFRRPRRLAIGRNSEGVATVCFRLDEVSTGDDPQAPVYRVALDGAVELPLAGLSGWVVR